MHLGGGFRLHYSIRMALCTCSGSGLLSLVELFFLFFVLSSFPPRDVRILITTQALAGSFYRFEVGF